MGSGETKKKIVILVICSALLVIMATGGTYGLNKINEQSREQEIDSLTASSKAVKSICETTDYKETCENNLALTNTSDPKELMKVSFQAAIINIGEAIQSSSLLKKDSSDSMTTQALDICKEVLNSAMKTIHRAIDKVDRLDLSKLENEIGDLRTWMGGAITFQETCLDGFENLAGGTGKKMKKHLSTSAKLTSNGLAMASSFTQILDDLPVHGNLRKLLQDGSSSGFPSFVDATSRRLLTDGGGIPKHNAVVAKDGSGQFRTINEALKAVPAHNKVPFIIFVKAGVYKEHVVINSHAMRVVLIGEGPTKTKITGNRNYADGTQTYHTATVAVDANNFIARDIGIENYAGPTKRQAVALRVSGDNTVFFNCQIDGYQDTLLAHNFRQFYRDCIITGTIDFVFGDAQAIFQNCKFIVRKPLPGQACMVTAQGRADKRGPGALLFQNCQILSSPELESSVKAYLGRPWKMYSNTIIMNSFIDKFIAPEGWSPWSGHFALDTLYYVEYENNGPGAGTAKRVTWKGIQKITPEIAKNFNPGKFYQAGDAWIKKAFVPYDSTITRA